MNDNCPQCGAPLPAGALAGLCPACLLKQGAATETATQPAAKPFEPPPVAELARLFPQLEILGLLGKGGMGAVYKARQPALDRLVALKILPAHGGADPGFAERFTREARALARLSHPGIVAVHEFGQVSGAGGSPAAAPAGPGMQRIAPAGGGTGERPVLLSFHYFIMEFVDGVNLRQLQQSHRLSPREALQIVPQICDALQYAHDEGVVHRDIKPENVLVDRKGRVKIADFGLAKILGRGAPDARLTGEGQVMGTPHYMAPEQVEHPLEVDHRADIFSLGVVFYEMLTGELPLGRFMPPSRKVQVDVRFDEVVLHALEKEPERRYQQASDVKTAVQGIAAGPANPPAAGPGPVMMPMPRWAVGLEYKSKATLWGWPVLHIAFGLDPATGRQRQAKGIIAIGSIARGGLAIGGVAAGGIAVGGTAVGLVALGGLAIGLFATGGLALALGLAVGGGALGPIAIGGGAYGFYADGGGAGGAHAVHALGADPAAWDFFEPWAMPFLRWSFVAQLGLTGVGLLVATGAMLWLGRQDRLLFRSGMFWGQTLLIFACAGLCLAPIPFLQRYLVVPSRYLVSGTVLDARTGQPLPDATVGRLMEQDQPRVEWQSQGWSGGHYAMVLRRPGGTVLAFAPGFETNFVAVAAGAFDRRRHARVELRLQRAPEASAETYSPALPPDLNRIFAEAREFMQQGRYEETLQRFIWYHHHAREYSTLSPWFHTLAILSDWIELGRRYAKAKEALLEIRDRMTQQLLHGRGYFELFMELSNINQYLQADDATYELFQKLAQKDGALAQQCFLVVQPLLVKHGQFEQCLRYMGDPQAAFNRIRQNWEMEIQSEQRAAELYQRTAQNSSAYHPPAPPKLGNDRFVNQTGQLIRILVATGHKSEAERIQAQAVAMLDDPRLKSAVADAEAQGDKR